MGEGWGGGGGHVCKVKATTANALRVKEREYGIPAGFVPVCLTIRSSSGRRRNERGKGVLVTPKPPDE
jgi:hypothetical protein